MYSVVISMVSFYGLNVCLEINDLIRTSAVFLPLKSKSEGSNLQQDVRVFSDTWRLLSFGMWHHNIPQETAVSFVRVERYRAWEEMVSNTKNRGHGVKGKTIRPTLLLLRWRQRVPPKSWYWSIKLHGSHPRGQDLHSHCCDNLKLSIFLFKHHAWPSYHLIQFSITFQLKKIITWPKTEVLPISSLTIIHLFNMT